MIKSRFSFSLSFFLNNFRNQRQIVPKVQNEEFKEISRYQDRPINSIFEGFFAWKSMLKTQLKEKPKGKTIQ